MKFNYFERAVRTSELATEDPLKLDFLSSFRCKCWTLNVNQLHNSSDYLTSTCWSMKTIKTWVFLRSSPRVKTSPRESDQSNTRRWIYALFPLYILPVFNVYRNANDCASRVMQLNDSQPIIYSANESLNAITSVLFTSLLMARKLYSFLLQGTEEIWVIYIGIFRAFCLLCQLMSCIIA